LQDEREKGQLAMLGNATKADETDKKKGEAEYTRNICKSTQNKHQDKVCDTLSEEDQKFLLERLGVCLKGKTLQGVDSRTMLERIQLYVHDNPQGIVPSTTWSF